MICQRKTIMVGFLITIISAGTLVLTDRIDTAAQTKNSRPISENRKKSRASDAETIVYTTFRPGNWDVFYFASRGSQPKRLTDDPGLDYDAVLSPDGRWVVFCSERRGNPELYVLDLQREGPPKLLIESDYMEDQAAFSPDGKSLVFVSDRDGTADIFKIPFTPEKTVRISKAVRLTNHDDGEFRPSFSPDGKKIAFSTDWDAAPTGPPAERSRQGEIYTMDADGKNLTQLTHSPGWDGSPKWSPDGRTIYFYAKRDGKFRIWAMDADGANQRPISPKDETALSPAITPDGRIAFAAKIGAADSTDWKIVSVALDGSDKRFESDKSNNYWIPDINTKSGAMVCHGPGPFEKDGTPREAAENLLLEGPLLIANTPEYARLPNRMLALYPIRKFGVSVDPTGQKLALTDSFYSSHYLAVTDLDGSQEQIIHERKDRKVVPGIYVPNWSKDGLWIAWMGGLPFGGPKEENDVWKIRPDGSGGPINLTPNTPGSEGFADFSGDGRTIVFRSGRTGNFDVYLMNSDGSNVRNLTNNPAYDSFPAFSPNNDQIAFSSNRDGVPEEKSGLKTFEIYTLNLKPDGSPGELRRLTNSPGQDSHPRYSPDGKWLVFTSEQGGINDEEPLIQELFFMPQMYGELYAVRLSDLKTIRLIHNKWEDGTPTWGGPRQGLKSAGAPSTSRK